MGVLAPAWGGLQLAWSRAESCHAIPLVNDDAAGDGTNGWLRLHSRQRYRKRDREGEEHGGPLVGDDGAVHSLTGRLGSIPSNAIAKTAEYLDVDSLRKMLVNSKCSDLLEAVG